MPTTTITFEVSDSAARGAFDRLQQELNETARAARRTNQQLHETQERFVAAQHSTDTFARSLGAVKRLLTGLGEVAVAGKEHLDVNAAAQMEGLQRGFAAREDSNAEPHRRDVNDIRRLPGLPTSAEVFEAFKIAIENPELRFPFVSRTARGPADPDTATGQFDPLRVRRNAQTADDRTPLPTQRTAARRREIELLENGFQDFVSVEMDTEAAQRERATQARIAAAVRARDVEVAAFAAATAAGAAYAEQLQEIATAHARIESEFPTDAAGSPQRGVPPFDESLAASIPDPTVRGAQIDAQIAEGARDVLGEQQRDAYREGFAFIQQLRSQDDRAAEQSLKAQERYYRQFANSVSSLFTRIVTGRIQGFEEVAKAFLAQSLRLVARAYVEYQIQKGLDDQLTAAKITNIQKVAAAQAAGGLAGSGAARSGIGSLIGNIPGLASIGSAVAGGGAALGGAALLFPQEIQNLTSGIKETIGGFLADVAAVPDTAFGAKQEVYLKIGDGEIRDITDIQDEMRQEARL